MNSAFHFWSLILGTVITLLPLINPLATAPTFLAITEGDTDERRHEQLRNACFYMIGILVSFLIGGTFIMNFFGISIPGLRIAGGLLVAGIGFGMLLGKNEAKPTDSVQAAARAKRDVSFSPLAMPMLSGPGSIAVTIGFTSSCDRLDRLHRNHPWNLDRRIDHLHRSSSVGEHGEDNRCRRHERPHPRHGVSPRLHWNPVHRERNPRQKGRLIPRFVNAIRDTLSK